VGLSGRKSIRSICSGCRNLLSVKTISIHRVKTHLPKLLEEMCQGESFIITRAGKPVAKLTGLNAQSGAKARRLGFMKGEIAVPDDSIRWAVVG
jgi:antitoxin (DNA-binding transcriptional repressor) of toxin-antitoxin stability system